MKKRKDQKQTVTTIIAILSLVVIATGGFFALEGYRAQTTKGQGSTSSNSYYSLRKNATEYQKELYDQLTEALKGEPRNHELLSQLVAQNYVADFYTWTNKVKQNDMGGTQFIHDDIRKWVYDKALDTIYHDMYYYLEEGKVKETLEVTDSKTTVEKVQFLMVEEVVDEESGEVTTPEKFQDAYRVHITWNFKPSTVVNIEDYDKEAYITVIVDEDGLYSIVEVMHEQTTDEEA